MRWLIGVVAVAAAVAAAARLRGRQPRYAYGRWRDGDLGMPRVVPIIDGP